MKCDICLKSFQFKSHLERHLAAHRNTTKARAFHVCHVCGHRSRDDSQMKRHMGSHMEKTLPCPQCSKMFPTTRDVTRHVQRIHNKAKSSCCDLCGKTFGSITHLRRHMLQMHLGEKFECNECGKKFSTNWYLKKHSKEMHGATFQFRCPHCRYDFKTAEQLQQHGDTCRNKPFQDEDVTCNRCGKIFERRCHLRAHQKREHWVHLPVISHRNPDLLPPRNQLTRGTNIDTDFKQVSLN